MAKLSGSVSEIKNIFSPNSLTTYNVVSIVLLDLRTKRQSINKISIPGDLNGKVRPFYAGIL